MAVNSNEVTEVGTSVFFSEQNVMLSKIHVFLFFLPECMVRLVESLNWVISIPSSP